MSGEEVDVEEVVLPGDLAWLREEIAAAGVPLRALAEAVGYSPARLSADLSQGTLSWDRVVAIAQALGCAIPVRRDLAVASAPRGAGWVREGQTSRRAAAGRGWRAVATPAPGGRWEITWYAAPSGPSGLGAVRCWTSRSLGRGLGECEEQAREMARKEGA